MVMDIGDKLQNNDFTNLVQIVDKLKQEGNCDYGNGRAILLKELDAASRSFPSQLSLPAIEALQWVCNNLFSGSFWDSINDVIDPIVEILSKTVIKATHKLNDRDFSINFQDEIFNLLSICDTAVSCSRNIAVLFSQGKVELVHDSIPPGLLADLLNLLDNVFTHCKERGIYYEEFNSDKLQSTVSLLFKDAVEAASELFDVLPTFAVTVTEGAPSTLARILSSTAQLCRNLSVLSEMKATVKGWKAMIQLLLDIKFKGLGKSLAKDGNSEISLIILLLSQEVQEGLELVLSLHAQPIGDIGPIDIVLKRVVKLFSFCVKLMLQLMETFFQYVGQEITGAVLRFVLIVARSCVSVSLLQNCDRQSDCILGGGLAGQLMLALKMLLALFVTKSDSISILSRSVVDWCEEVQTLEKAHLCSENYSGNWATTAGGPLLLMIFLSLHLPEALQKRGHNLSILKKAEASALSESDTEQFFHFPVIILASLLVLAPFCSALFCSRVKVVTLSREGAAAEAQPLYDCALQAACVAVGVTAAGDHWYHALLWLFSSVLALDADKVFKQVQMDSMEQLSSRKVCMKSDESCSSNSEDDFLECSTERRNSKRKIKQQIFGSHTYPDPKFCGCENLLASQSAATRRQWLWPHLLASDTLGFAVRLGSGALCSSVYSELVKATIKIPEHNLSLRASLSVQLIRLQRYLPQPLEQLPPSSAERDGKSQQTLEMQCVLAGACLFIKCGRTGPTYSVTYVQSCRLLLNTICRQLTEVITEILDEDSTKVNFDELEYSLRCLHLLLQPRLLSAGDNTELCDEKHILTETSNAVIKLLYRVSLLDASVTAAHWFLPGLLAVTAPCLDLLTPERLNMVLGVCRTLVVTSAPDMRLRLTDFIAGLSKCRSLESHVQCQDDTICDLFAEFCACLVSEVITWQVQQRAFKCFVFFAQRTTCKQVITAVLQRCSPEVKDRLQRFLQHKPHPAPKRKCGEIPTCGRNILDDSKNNSASDSTPLFLFHQQCTQNVENGQPEDQTDVANCSVILQTVLESCTLSHVRKDDQCQSSQKRSHSAEGEKLLQKICTVLDQSKDHLKYLVGEGSVSTEDLTSILASAETMLMSIENSHLSFNEHKRRKC